MHFFSKSSVPKDSFLNSLNHSHRALQLSTSLSQRSSVSPQVQTTRRQLLQGFHRANSLSTPQHELKNNRTANSVVRETSPLVFSSLSKPQLMPEIQLINSLDNQPFYYKSKSYSLITNKTLQNNKNENEQTTLIIKQEDIESENDQCETTKLLTLTKEPQKNQSYNIHPNDSFA